MREEPAAPTAPMLIHVGLHKCASTWLQNMIFSRPDLGFVSPWGAMSHMAVTEFVTVDPLDFDARETAAKFHAAEIPEASTKPHLLRVLSHEALSSRPHHGHYYAPLVADRLNQVFPGARLLLLFREQVGIIHSLYGEHIRNGGRNRLDEFIGHGDEPPGWSPICKLSFFRYDRLIAMYEGVFGAENVLALPMEMLRTDPEGLTKRIFRFAGLPDAPVETEKVANRGWGGLTVEAVRRSNGLVRKNPLGGPSGALYDARQWIAWRADRLVPAALNDRRRKAQRDFIKTRVADFYRQSNQALSQSLGIDLKSLGYDC